MLSMARGTQEDLET